MNNEEKILEMLIEMRSDIAELKATQVKQGEQLSEQGEQLAQINDRLEELDDRSLRSAVMLENQVLPQLQLLYEGQVTLQQTLAPKERVEVLEDDVITLKTVVKSISNRLAALEKAQ